MMINNDAYISVLPYLGETPRECTYLPKETGIFPVKIGRN